MVKKIIGAALFILVIFLFCYFRLKPLYFQTVGYTYDQGRDFLKAAEIIRDRNITFIGPTTGIQGLFHGAWYYYLLVIPYLLFNGSPIGFYYFNFIINLLSLILIMYFINKWFSKVLSLLIGTIIASSPYFIFTSLFVGNNIFVLPLLVLFIICNYYLFNTEKVHGKLLWFTAGLIPALIFEFEVAFGLFLVPSYLVLILAKKSLRSDLFIKKRVLYFIIGLIIPFIPRTLFEIKNNFMQIKTMFSYLSQPKIFNPRSFTEIFADRLKLFWDYFKGIFSHEFILYSFLITVIICLLIVFTNRKKSNFRTLAFFMSILLLLFICSLFYKDNFWGNYYEGIQYIFLIIAANIFSLAAKKVKFIFIILSAILILNQSLSLNSLIKDWRTKPKRSLLANQLEIVNFIANEIKNDQDQEYCVKVYTPPVIPHTYRYLFLHKEKTAKIPYPEENWVDRKCWYIVESDDNKERRAEWLKNNIPRVAKMTQKKVFNDVDVLHYEIE